MKPNYYAIIPADVRYDERLTPNAKLLYGEITALSGKNGQCWALNDYFAKLYKVDKRTITRWITDLKNCNYISVTIKRDSENKIIERIVKIVGRSRQNCREGIDKIVRDNSIVNSNNIININNRKSKTSKKVSDYADNYIKCYDAIIELFPQRTRPKTTAQKIKWLDTIRLADEKDNCNPRQLWWIVNKARNDSFWQKNVLSIPELRKSKEGRLPKLEQLIQKLGGREFDALR